MSQKYIYALVDPRNAKIRYVGITKCCKARMKNHKRTTVEGAKNYRAKWMRKLYRMGLHPRMMVLEIVSSEEGEEKERWWIAHGRLNKWPLTNLTDGGDGACGYKHPEAFKKRMSILKKGLPKSEETKRKIGEGNRGKVRSPELRAYWSRVLKRMRRSKKCREKMSKARQGISSGPCSPEKKALLSKLFKGRVMSPVGLAKIIAHSKNAKGKPLSDEVKLKLSLALKGHSTSKACREKIAAKAKARWANPEFKKKLKKALSRGSQKRWARDRKYPPGHRRRGVQRVYGGFSWN